MKTLHFFLVAALLLLCTGQSITQWVQVGSNMGQVWEVVLDPINEQVIYAGSNSSGIWKTTNGGTNWVQVNTGLGSLAVQALAISRTNSDILYCGTASGLYLTVDGGGSWFAINSGITETTIAVQAIAIDPTTSEIAYVAIFDGLTNATNGIYKTTDNGVTWAPATNGLGAVKNFLSFAINPLNPKVVYAGSSYAQPVTADQARVYKSTNSAASWFDVSNGLPATQGSTTHDPIRKLSIQASDTNRVLAAIFLNDTLGGAYLTTNGGASWTKRSVGLPSGPAPGTTPRAILIRPGTTNEFYVGIGTERGIYKTTNAGAGWTAFNNGALTDTATIRQFAYAPTSRYLYAGAAHASNTALQGVFRTQLAPVSVPELPSGIPADFVLYQNYPNPFNPTTKIAFGLPERQDVTLKVYNVLGQEVKTLMETDASPGYHEVDFDATGLTSGMYFYRLQTGTFAQTKRLLLMK